MTDTTAPSPISFISAGQTCRGIHFPPLSEALTGPAGAPCVVMGHGFGATVDCGLEDYARRFAQAGMHAVAFDYRSFGLSDGEPRQNLSIAGQLADWQAALDFVRGMDGVDGERVAAWGTSFGGGNALEAAVRDGRVAAVVAQCPMMDGLTALLANLRTAGVLRSLQVTAYAIADALWSGLLGLKPIRVPIAAPPGELGIMTSPDAFDGYQSLTPEGWVNAVCARIALTAGFYRPGLHADKLPCKALFLICETDSVAPAQAAEAAAHLAGKNAVIRTYPFGHFDIYQGKNQQMAMGEMVAFLVGELALKTPPRSPPHDRS